MADETILLLVDTDIGSDIDDAVCLAYLLRQPRCKLLGITTVTGHTGERAAVAEVVCRAAGRTDIPIHAGSPGPLWIGTGQPTVHHYEAIAHRPHRLDYPPHTAVEFLRQTIRSRPHEITLLGIGPLTNLGLLFALDPEIPSLLRELVLMCGVFTTRTVSVPDAREYNAMTDPIATAIVFAARPPRFTAIGLDVTKRCSLPAAECRRRFAAAGGPLAIVAEMAEVWFRHRPDITFHDPLAGAAVFEPSLCACENGQVTVEWASAALAGLTSWNAKTEPAPHRIALDVDPARFFEHYFSIVGG